MSRAGIGSQPWKFRLVGEKLQQGNLYTGFVLGGHKTAPPPPHQCARILKVYIRRLNSIQSQIESRWFQQYITLSRTHPLSQYGNSRWNTHSKDKGRNKESLIAWVQLWVNQWSQPLDDLLQHLAQLMIASTLIQLNHYLLIPPMSQTLLNIVKMEKKKKKKAQQFHSYEGA